MKLNQYLVCFSALFVVTGILSCTKMDDYKAFYKDKEIVYPGKANTVKTYPGNKRIQLSWLLNDPKVTSYKVYWDNRSDSVSGSLTDINLRDTVKLFINNLTEGIHSFRIVTFDKKGNTSVPVDTVGTVFGDIYQGGLLNRLLRSASLYKGKVTVEWYDAANGTARSEIKYTDNTNAERKVRIQSTAAITELPNYKEGSSLQYRTLFLPDSMAIDTFYTAYNTVQPELVQALRLSTGKVYTASKRSAEVAKPFDGNPTTYWYSTGAPFPEWVQVDLLADYDISRLRTQFHDKTDNIYSYRIEISNDNISWRTLVPGGGRQGVTGAYAIFEHQVNERGRYVRITFTGNTKGHWASIAEFEVWGN